MKTIFPMILLLFGLSLANAQEKFSLDMAIESALEHNYQVQISRIMKENAEQNITPGNAGLLPTVFINSELTGSYSDIELTPGSFFNTLLGQDAEQKKASGSVNYDGVTSYGIGAGVGAQYVIYDGFKGRYRYKLLQMSGQIADLQLRSEMENTVLLITRYYINAASIQKAIRLKELALEQSFNRFRIVETRREYGQANEQQLLQALADLKSDSTQFRDLKLQYENAYRDLNTAIGWGSREMLTLDEEPQNMIIPEYGHLLNSLSKNNTALHVREKRIQQAQIDKKLKRTNFFPTVTASAQYGFNYLSASAGQFETQKQIGVTGGVSLRIPLYSGGQNNSAMRNANAMLRQEQLRYDETEQQIRTRFDNLWQEFQHLENRYKTEIENLTVYERNYDRAKDAYGQGLITGVEVRTAQISLENARLRLAETRFERVLTATNLLYLTGLLLY